LVNDIGEKFISLSRLFADDTSPGYSSQSVDQIKSNKKTSVWWMNTCQELHKCIFS
jgi:hypothetical protein